MYSLCLASQSPRRRELLAALGLEFTVLSADIDETPQPGEPVDQLVARLAQEKARAVSFDGWVLASDTLVTIDGEPLGKPIDQSDFEHMMARLGGRWHEVLTSWHLTDGVRALAGVETTRVAFNRLTAAQIAAYWASGEPQDKAGGYGIQGRGGLFVEQIEGDYTAVVGLPVKAVAQALASVGIDPWRLHAR